VWRERKIQAARGNKWLAGQLEEASNSPQV